MKHLARGWAEGEFSSPPFLGRFLIIISTNNVEKVAEEAYELFMYSNELSISKYIAHQTGFKVPPRQDAIGLTTERKFDIIVTLWKLTIFEQKAPCSKSYSFIYYSFTCRTLTKTYTGITGLNGLLSLQPVSTHKKNALLAMSIIKNWVALGCITWWLVCGVSGPMAHYYLEKAPNIICNRYWGYLKICWFYVSGLPGSPGGLFFVALITHVISGVCNVVYAAQHTEDCSDLYIGGDKATTTQTLCNTGGPWQQARTQHATSI